MCDGTALAAGGLGNQFKFDVNEGVDKHSKYSSKTYDPLNSVDVVLESDLGERLFIGSGKQRNENGQRT